MGCQQSIALDVASATLNLSVSHRSIVLKRGVTFADAKPASSAASVQTARTAYSTSTISDCCAEDVSDLENGPKLDHNGHLTTEEIVKRTSSSVQTSALSIGKGTKQFEIEYAFQSQRGYDPEEPSKPNQEKHDIQLNFGSEGGDIFIGIYSGHGEKGKQCANICDTQVPKQLAKFIRQKRVQRYSAQLKADGNMKKGGWNPKAWPILSAADYEHCCKRAYKETKTILQRQDDTLSGASALTVSFHGGTMYVSSVGGCGAILGRRCEMDFDRETEKQAGLDFSFSKKGKRTVIPLTDDHTLDCQEELERIRLSGAEIKESDEFECSDDSFDVDENDDSSYISKKPLQVCYPGENRPSARFSRSICDSSLESIGIIAEPSVTSIDLTPQDDILILASPAVFTFLTQQEIMDIGSAFHNTQQASQAIIKAAYDRWIENTGRCEDLTVKVCFLSNFYEPPRRVRMPSDIRSVMAYDSEDDDEDFNNSQHMNFNSSQRMDFNSSQHMDLQDSDSIVN